MDITYIDSVLLDNKISCLKCESSSTTVNWYKEEYYGSDCCTTTNRFSKKDYDLLIEILTYYRTRTVTSNLATILETIIK